MIGNKTSFKNNAVAKLGETATRSRDTTTEDGMGGVMSITPDTIEVTVIFGNISAKDLKIHEMGLAVQGNLKLYFDADQDIIEGDTIIRADGIKWHLEKISSEYSGVFKIGIVRNISLKGSE